MEEGSRLNAAGCLLWTGGGGGSDGCLATSGKKDVCAESGKEVWDKLLSLSLLGEERCVAEMVLKGAASFFVTSFSAHSRSSSSSSSHTPLPLDLLSNSSSLSPVRPPPFFKRFSEQTPFPTPERLMVFG